MLFDACGWVGAACVIVAYALVSYGRMSPASTRYQGLNVAGSVMLIINTAYHAAWPSAVVNIVWAAIALSALVRRTREVPAA
jgi:hypothetical protein